MDTSMAEPLVDKIPDTGSAVATINKTVSFDVGSWLIEPTYWQVGAIILLLFLLVWTLARLRHMYVHWSMKGFMPSVFFGFLLAVILEALLFVGGRSMFITVLGWQNAPKPIGTAIDEGRSELIEVLGVEAEVPTYQSVSTNYSRLSETQREQVKTIICTEE